MSVASLIVALAIWLTGVATMALQHLSVNPIVVSQPSQTLGSPVVLSYVETANATSTMTYTKNGYATTTLAWDDPEMESLSLDVILASSTTIPKLDYKVEVSRNAVDWFPVTVDQTPTATTSITTMSGKTYNIIPMASSTSGSSYMTNSGSATTTYFYVRTPSINVNAQHARVILSNSATASFDLWARLIPLRRSFR